MRLQKFQVSDPLFWGYQITLDIDSIYTSTDIIEILKNDMIDYFKNKNLELLIQELISIHFHVKNINIIKNNPNEDIIYICNHIHCSDISCHN